MSRPRFRLCRPLPVALAIGGAALLAGCGVKGPLEMPPHAASADPVLNAPAGTPTPAPSLPAGTTVGTTTTAVVQAPAARQRSVFDWLLD